MKLYCNSHIGINELLQRVKYCNLTVIYPTEEVMHERISLDFV